LVLAEELLHSLLRVTGVVHHLLVQVEEQHLLIRLVNILEGVIVVEEGLGLFMLEVRFPQEAGFLLIPLGLAAFRQSALILGSDCYPIQSVMNIEVLWQGDLALGDVIVSAQDHRHPSFLALWRHTDLQVLQIPVDPQLPFVPLLEDLIKDMLLGVTTLGHDHFIELYVVFYLVFQLLHLVPSGIVNGGLVLGGTWSSFYLGLEFGNLGKRIEICGGSFRPTFGNSILLRTHLHNNLGL